MAIRAIGTPSFGGGQKAPSSPSDKNRWGGATLKKKTTLHLFQAIKQSASDNFTLADQDMWLHPRRDTAGGVKGKPKDGVQGAIRDRSVAREKRSSFFSSSSLHCNRLRTGCERGFPGA